MRKNFLKLGALSLLSVCLLTNTSTVHATSKRITIPALGNGYNKSCGAEKRSGDYSYCKAKCNYVKPNANIPDTFENIRVRLCYKDNSGTRHLLSSTNPGSDYDYYVPEDKNYRLCETGGSKKVPIKDDKMNIQYVYFEFCGNSIYHDAKTEVTYNAK
ncbi:MAG: hypothetical protein II838_03470 [Lachnospiraceae bacterium]|nr:hypothetical protein [Lachnospiraceae bacterium]